MQHPLSRYASPPSLACGGRGAEPTDRLSRFRGAPGWGSFNACGSRCGAVNN